MAVAYSVSSVTAKDGAASADFKVKRTGTSAELKNTTSVDYSTQDVSAKAGTDYVSTSGSLSFAADVAEQTISVGIIDEAYSSSAVLTFLLSLAGFGAATGSISPSPSGDNKQTYLYIPEDDTLTAIPTSESPGSNLPHQAVSKDFSDPPEGQTQLDKPLAYFRLGYARADLNYYERIILNTDTYHPVWRDGDADADPVEQGAMHDFMLPRALDRTSDSDVSSREEKNKHLDGVLIYSDKNYNLTVGEQASTVVQGDYVQTVQGAGRLNWMGTLTEWEFDPDKNGAFRKANGVTKINGQDAVYDITSIRTLDVKAEQQVSYSFGAKYSVSTDAEMSITNAAQYEIANSIKLEVKGLQIAGECDIMGNFEVRYPTGEVMSTRGEYGLAASEEINLSIQAGTSKAWTAAVAVAAAANSAAALLISSGVAASTFRSDSDFYKLATPESLESSYNDAVADAVPDTCAGLAAVTAGILVAAAVAQAIAEELPDPMPKIEMTPMGLKLSVGPQSFIQMTDMDIILSSPTITMDAEAGVAVVAGADIDLTATVDINLESVGITLTGDTVADDITCGDINAMNIDALELVTA